MNAIGVTSAKRKLNSRGQSTLLLTDEQAQFRLHKGIDKILEVFLPPWPPCGSSSYRILRVSWPSSQRFILQIQRGLSGNENQWKWSSYDPANPRERHSQVSQTLQTTYRGIESNDSFWRILIRVFLILGVASLTLDSRIVLLLSTRIHLRKLAIECG